MSSPIAVESLEKVEEWCKDAKRGDQARFTVLAEVTQEQASTLAKKVNEARLDHVWIEIQAKPPGAAPEIVTPIQVRCSH